MLNVVQNNTDKLIKTVHIFHSTLKCRCDMLVFEYVSCCEDKRFISMCSSVHPKTRASERKHSCGPRAWTGLFMCLSPKGSSIVYMGKMYAKSKYAILTNLAVAVFSKNDIEEGYPK